MTIRDVSRLSFISSAQSCVAATLARVTGVSAVVLIAASAHAGPTVEERLISWQDEGWYQVQDAQNYTTICEGFDFCEVPAGGFYIVINLSTGERYERVQVAGAVTENSVIQVAGMVIDYPPDGWYQVQNSATYETICEGFDACEVPEAGFYHVINLSTGVRHEYVEVTAETPPETPEPYDPDDPTLPPPSIPELDDPFALPLPLPDPSDPFGALLEIDDEEPIAGGAPTQPKNLRFDLISNNWAEISWAPANDDVAVVQYNIYRSDGVVYEIRADQTHPASGSQEEIDKYWATTSFIDCNFTRFDTLVHACSTNQPQPGVTYTYTVTAIDDEGQESIESEPLTFTYLKEVNAPVPLYDDLYKGADDRFVQEHDLSAVPYFLSEFDLVFADEFEGEEIDPDKWQTGLTWGDNRIINGEQQYFVNTQANPDFGYDPFELNGETLTINAIPVPDELRANLPPVCEEPDPTGKDRCEFLSGALSSHDRFQYIYGYIEGRFKVSGTPGALSSFYLYHRYSGGGAYFHAPEIDVVEYLGENPYGNPDAFQTYHFGDTATGITRSAPTMSYARPDGGTYADNDEWHTFGVLWEPQLVVWYIDGREVKRMFGPQVSRQPMNIVNYLVAGSGWAPTPDISNPEIFPIRFEADYIRVYQRDAFKSTATFGN